MSPEWSRGEKKPITKTILYLCSENGLEVAARPASLLPVTASTGQRGKAFPQQTGALHRRESRGRTLLLQFLRHPCRRLRTALTPLGKNWRRRKLLVPGELFISVTGQRLLGDSILGSTGRLSSLPQQQDSTLRAPRSTGSLSRPASNTATAALSSSTAGGGPPLRKLQVKKPKLSKTLYTARAVAEIFSGEEKGRRISLLKGRWTQREEEQAHYSKQHNYQSLSEEPTTDLSGKV